ncbi:3-methyl-2-oxobutanoate hydroxymethyltransferase [Staphylococcus aureus]
MLALWGINYKVQQRSSGATYFRREKCRTSWCSCVSLEAIPNDLAEEISKHLTIPVIGIGAGKGTDGQVLVYHDMLNYGVEHKAKFVKQFADFSVGVDGLKQYDQEVKSGAFPSEEYTYKKKIMNEVNNND